MLLEKVPQWPNFFIQSHKQTTESRSGGDLSSVFTISHQRCHIQAASKAARWHCAVSDKPSCVATGSARIKICLCNLSNRIKFRLPVVGCRVTAGSCITAEGLHNEYGTRPYDKKCHFQSSFGFLFFCNAIQACLFNTVVKYLFRSSISQNTLRAHQKMALNRSFYCM